MKILRMTLLLLIALLATSVQAETVNCTPITSLPATITASGIYCLTGNLNTSQTTGNAITITAKYVTLDLNGWRLDGHKAGTGTTATGIYSTGNDVTIKNGIVHGFYEGIYLAGSGDVVQGVLADTNYNFGILTEGPGALVEHNQVVNTGSSTTQTNVDAAGIVVTGHGSTVSDNMVSGVTAEGGGNAVGISLSGYNSTVRNNVVSNTALPSGGGFSYGIILYGSIALNNTVSNFQYGIYIYSGGIYAYNTVNSCTTDFTGGTAGAGDSGT